MTGTGYEIAHRRMRIFNGAIDDVGTRVLEALFISVSLHSSQFARNLEARLNMAAKEKRHKSHTMQGDAAWQVGVCGFWVEIESSSFYYCR